MHPTGEWAHLRGGQEVLDVSFNMVVLSWVYQRQLSLALPCPNFVTTTLNVDQVDMESACGDTDSVTELPRLDEAKYFLNWKCMVNAYLRRTDVGHFCFQDEPINVTSTITCK